MRRHRSRRHPAGASGVSAPSARRPWQQWRVMVPLSLALAVFLFMGWQQHWDARMLAAVTVLFGLLSGLFVWLLAMIGLVPLIGPIIVKVLSLSFIWLLNACGYLVSYVAIRRGYSKDVLTYRGLTIALLIGIVIGYIVAQFV